MSTADKPAESLVALQPSEVSQVSQSIGALAPARRVSPATCPAPTARPRDADVWLSWRGRRWVSDEAEPAPAAPPSLVTTESVDHGRWSAATAGPTSEVAHEPGAFRLIQGDALDVAAVLAGEGVAGAVDLVYVDPPFASQAAYVHEARLDGPADGRVVRSPAYDDRWGEGLGPYLDMLAPRLEAAARLLSPRGTLWVHVDYRASYLVRLLLDEILGRDAFKNEIVWRRAPNLGRQAASRQFGRTLDTIVVYGAQEASLTPPTRLEPIAPGAMRVDEEGRPFTSAPRGDYTDESIRRLDAEGRVHRTPSGKVYIKYFLVKDAEGAWCRERRVDALWADVPPLRHARVGERTGFPTQKPRALLDRIVACASPRGGLVVDLFAGSGTTGESAHALGRRFVLGDASPMALAIARARLLRAGVPLVVQALGTAASPDAGDAVRASLDRSGPGARVELLHPREPLAWAVDPAYDPRGPFRAAWHGERAPGARAVRAPVEATLERASGPVGVRVWYDDGRVSTGIAEEA